jgi:hypothetical protein
LCCGVDHPSSHTREALVRLGASDTNYRTEWASGGYVSIAEEAAAAELYRAFMHRHGVEVDDVN